MDDQPPPPRPLPATDPSASGPPMQFAPAPAPALATAPAPAPAAAPAAASSLLAPPRSRWLWLLLAYVSLGIGIVAIVIPGIPTTEFILLAAWAATRSSPRLAAWLERHRLFGPMIYNWRHGRVVARRAKLSATCAMSVCLLIMVWVVPQRWVVVLAAVGMAAGAAWMWSRPERVG